MSLFSEQLRGEGLVFRHQHCGNQTPHRSQQGLANFLALQHKIVILTVLIYPSTYKQRHSSAIRLPQSVRDDLLKKLLAKSYICNMCIFILFIGADFTLHCFLTSTQVITFQARHQKRLLTYYQQRVREINLAAVDVCLVFVSLRVCFSSWWWNTFWWTISGY